MSRVRTDNVFGTTTDNPLTNVATTMNSAGLANLAAVSSAEAIITLDPNRVAGAPEIVVVTAHTGSATSATIQRGQFGTTARQHASGTAWVHGPIAANATTYATASDDQGDFVPMNAWEAYTPTDSGITLGDGTRSAKFVRHGRTIHFLWEMALGSTSAISADAKVGLPVAGVASQRMSVAATYRDTGTRMYTGTGVVGFSTASLCDLFHTESGNFGTVNGTNPFTWTTSDVIYVCGTYEAAS